MLLKKIISSTSKKYYQSVDEMILHNWINCNKGNLMYVRKNIDVGSFKEDIIAWDKIQNDYLAKFGISEKLSELIELQKDYANAQTDYVITRDRRKLNNIEALRVKLEKFMTNNGNDVETDEILTYMSKYYGYRMNKFELTVVEYFNLIKVWQSQLKEAI